MLNGTAPGNSASGGSHGWCSRGGSGSPGCTSSKKLMTAIVTRRRPAARWGGTHTRGRPGPTGGRQAQGRLAHSSRLRPGRQAESGRLRPDPAAEARAARPNPGRPRPIRPPTVRQKCHPYSHVAYERVSARAYEQCDSGSCSPPRSRPAPSTPTPCLPAPGRRHRYPRQQRAGRQRIAAGRPAIPGVPEGHPPDHCRDRRCRATRPCPAARHPVTGPGGPGRSATSGIRAGLPADSIMRSNALVKQERRSGWGT